MLQLKKLNEYFILWKENKLIYKSKQPPPKESQKKRGDEKYENSIIMEVRMKKTHMNLIWGNKQHNG